MEKSLIRDVHCLELNINYSQQISVYFDHCYMYIRDNFNFFKDFIYLFLDRREGGRETSVCGCLLHAPHWGPSPSSQACALTGNRTSDHLVHSLVLNPLSHTSQDRDNFNF